MLSKRNRSACGKAQDSFDAVISAKFAARSLISAKLETAEPFLCGFARAAVSGIHAGTVMHDLCQSVRSCMSSALTDACVASTVLLRIRCSDHNQSIIGPVRNDTCNAQHLPAGSRIIRRCFGPRAHTQVPNAPTGCTAKSPIAHPTQFAQYTRRRSSERNTLSTHCSCRQCCAAVSDQR